MSVEVKLSSGVPETPDGDVAVECMMERFDHECIAHTLRNQVLKNLPKVTSDGHFLDGACLASQVQERVVRLDELGPRYERHPCRGKVQSA